MALTRGSITNLIMLCSRARHLGTYCRGIFIYLVVELTKQEIECLLGDGNIMCIMLMEVFIVFHGLWHCDKEILLVFRVFLDWSISHCFSIEEVSYYQYGLFYKNETKKMTMERLNLVHKFHVVMVKHLEIQVMFVGHLDQSWLFCQLCIMAFFPLPNILTKFTTTYCAFLRKAKQKT
jgi:hypothetical protein